MEPYPVQRLDEKCPELKAEGLDVAARSGSLGVRSAERLCSLTDF